MRMTLRSLGAILLAGVTALGCSGSSSSGGSSASTASGSTSPGSLFGGTSGPGATGGGTTTGGTTTPTPPPPRQPMAGAWYVGDMHSHSATHSDDARRQGGDPIDITVRVAENEGLDFLAGTDHRTNDVLTDPNFTSQTMVLLRGMEWGGSMHATAVGQSAAIQESSTQSGAALVAEIDAIIADVHAKGGIFSLNHPCDPGKLWVVEPADFDGIEIWNSQWSLTAFEKAKQSDLDDKLNSSGLTAAGITNPHIQAAVADQRGSSNLQAVTLWESYLNSGRRLAAIGGGDRHMLFAQGKPTTHVYTAARTEQGILDGIRQGRTYVSRTVAGPLVDFSADEDGDGIYEALIGDEVAPGSSVSFRIVVEGAPGGRVDLIKRGAVIRSEPILSSTHILVVNEVPAAGDWYRVDVYEEIPLQTQQTHGTILQLAQLSGKPWAALASLLTMIPSNAFDTSLGTVLPILRVPDEVDKLLNASLKDPGYCRGAITSPIYTR